MSAALSRARLAAIGCDIVALDGPPESRRGAALLRALAGTSAPAPAFDALATVPDWLRLPRPAQRKLAQRAALASLSASLIRTIDGRGLAALAEQAGEEALDWAMDVTDEVAERRALPPLGEGETLATRGAVLLRASLPPALRTLVEAPAAAVLPPADKARACVEAALAA